MHTHGPADAYLYVRVHSLDEGDQVGKGAWLFQTLTPMGLPTLREERRALRRAAWCAARRTTGKWPLQS